MSKHKMVVTIPCGPKDQGAEQELELAFSYLPGGKATRDDPGWGAEIEFLAAAPLCNGKPAPFFYNSPMQRDIQKAGLDDLARNWLESDEGQAAACEEVAAELEDARAFVAELRRSEQ